MFERYTEAAKRVVFLARSEAVHAGADAIASEHLLLGHLRERHGSAAGILSIHGITLERVEGPSMPAPEWKPAMKREVEIALRERMRRLLVG